MAPKEIRNVGLIGLGKMGLPMARHLVKRGFTVAGFDVTEDAMEGAAEAGVRTALSPQAVAAASDLVIIVVGFDQEVEAVMFGERGVLAGARDGSVIAVASTIAPQTMQRIASRLPASPKVALLDIPLCRGEGPAQTGDLLIMGGGDRAAFDACRPAFESFATSIHHLGPVGAGQVGKMVNNLILWACISANEEGFKLAQALGIERETLRTALLDSSAGNWSLETRPEEKPMPWAEKDMTIVLKEADAARLSLPLCGVIKEVIKTVKQERGWPTPKAPGD
ncbi:MAG: NAD(P)-dependent oxidoreductase [Xanthobacteraceae bacterium]|nr:NAD(P)-dependent oxidoreductase [Xanthobacteraceae bacterium]